ncbi:MAG: hypothetical protein OXC96_03815 [Cyanobacteria bacterium MAG CAR1_bin_15]|nr:hypothetical protein [Cyanobacteria bacterium MAG CAR1_bin_15]
MDLLFNDLSIHGQFHDVDSFRQALQQLRRVHAAAKDLQCEVYCNSRLLNATYPIPGMSMQEAIGQLNKEMQRAIMTWWTKSLVTNHEGNQNLKKVIIDQVRVNTPLTETMIGRAVLEELESRKCGLVSMINSDWEFSPVKVKVEFHHNNISKIQCVEILNWWSPEKLRNRLLEDILSSINSWNDFQEALRKYLHSERLKFSEKCFKSLSDSKVNFHKSSANSLLNLLHILEQLAGAFDANGRRTDESHKIYQDYFTGDNALFSDSSDREKQHFKRNLTFPHPEHPGQEIFCPYHGKERHLTLRLHFSWPIQPGKPVYVVYIGPKLTKR